MGRLVAGLCLTLLFMTAPVAAGAQETPPTPEASQRLDLARRFIGLIQTDQMGAMLGQQLATMRPNASDDMAPEERAAFDRAMLVVTQQMTVTLFDAMAPIYADIFTLEELRALVAFYESDVGRSMMTKSYAAAPRITAVMMEMMPNILRDMAGVLCDEMECTAEERRGLKAAMAEAQGQ